MAYPWVLFENILADGTLTVTSEAAGFPVENLIDWRPWTGARWKATSAVTQNIDVDLGVGNTASPDTVVIGGHNLGDQTTGRMRVFHSDDGASYTGDYTVAASRVNYGNLPDWKTFTASAHRYWRVQLSAATPVTAFQAGVVTLGRRVEFEGNLPSSLDPYRASARMSPIFNALGAPLGCDVAGREWEFNVETPNEGHSVSGFYAPSSGLTWDTDWRNHALRDGKPFWFAWDTDVRSDGIYLCRANADATPLMHNADRRRLAVTMRGWREVA